MTRLEGLIDDAAGDSVPVASLLRQVKVVAARMNAELLGAWVKMELDGYGPDDELPSYRGPFQSPVFGKFVGPFGLEVTQGIPEFSVPERFRGIDGLFGVELRQSVEQVATLVPEGDSLRLAWPSEAVAVLNTLHQKGEWVHFPEGLGLFSAWKVVPKFCVTGILDAVRTKVLDLALELERVAPKAGEPGGRGWCSSGTGQADHSQHDLCEQRRSREPELCTDH
ncbi:hypothetical protein ONR57_18120 [Hoyosella sp. YIM 151337]|uniref:AbiTii domain-containing protein n=1 Tax=Hoyosella sp. YIM 151337 TaxID=2992742 RepID=UPI00223582AE|nr:hypothetical protein [Hoyosella sp. YIM 151337]MCW4355224.1 hypothetical protein [Hoyosella sp. YIM 151337]